MSGQSFQEKGFRIKEFIGGCILVAAFFGVMVNQWVRNLPNGEDRKTQVVPLAENASSSSPAEIEQIGNDIGAATEVVAATMQKPLIYSSDRRNSIRK